MRYVGSQDMGTIKDSDTFAPILPEDKHIKPQEILIVLQLCTVHAAQGFWDKRLKVLSSTGNSWFATNVVELKECFKKLVKET